jgi:hypothetical protein
MAQAVSRRLFVAEARVHARVTPYVGFVVDEQALGQVFAQNSLIFLCQYHSAVASRLYITCRMNSRSVGDRSSGTWSHPVDMKNSMTVAYSETRRLKITRLLFFNHSYVDEM